ncbi:MAG: glycosyltransferase family 1 protein, partial [Chitinophagaceae bacterium]
ALVERLVSAGYNVHILTTGNAEGLQLARNNGFSVIHVMGSTQHPSDILKYLKNLRSALKKIRPHAVLTFTIRPAIWGNIVTRLLKIPTITNITGIGPLFDRNNIAYKAARMLYKFVLKKTAHVFFQNYDDLNIFTSRGFVSKERAERIPGSGVDAGYYAPIQVEKSEVFTFLFISRLVKDKGIIEYVEAAGMLADTLPDCRFEIIGPLWEQNLKDNTVTAKDIEQWKEEGVVSYLGEKKDVRPYIAAADCIVLPSYREGTSNVLLEASAMERPSITCNTTGCREIVEDGVTGFLCRVKDVNDLAEKMKLMYELEPSARLLMGKNARKKVISEFSKQQVIDAYLRAIEKVTS